MEYYISAVLDLFRVSQWPEFSSLELFFFLCFLTQTTITTIMITITITINIAAIIIPILDDGDFLGSFGFLGSFVSATPGPKIP